MAESKATLAKAANRLAARGMARAMLAASAVVGNELLRRTPRAAPSIPGQVPLVDSVVVDIDVNEAAGSGHAEIGFGTEGYRAQWVEYGHVQRSHDGKLTGFTPAHPFMRPTVAVAGEAAIEAAAESLESTVSEEFS